MHPYPCMHTYAYNICTHRHPYHAWLYNVYAHTYMHAHTHACTHAHTHARTHAHTHTHTPSSEA